MPSKINVILTEVVMILGKVDRLPKTSTLTLIITLKHN